MSKSNSIHDELTTFTNKWGECFPRLVSRLDGMEFDLCRATRHAEQMEAAGRQDVAFGLTYREQAYHARKEEAEIMLAIRKEMRDHLTALANSI